MTRSLSACSLHTPEEGFEVLWQLSAAGIARVHGDEDTDGWLQGDVLALKREAFFTGFDGVLNSFHLSAVAIVQHCFLGIRIETHTWS